MANKTPTTNEYAIMFPVELHVNELQRKLHKETLKVTWQ
jgi:hypothetical protein